MKVLKGIGVGILSFLLFLSLSAFGLAFMLRSTLLNPDFVNAEVNEVDILTLVKEMTEEQIGEQLPEEASFVKEAIYDIIADHEPWLKEQLNIAIYSGYDFLMGKIDRLNITIPLEYLKENLRDRLWQTFQTQLSGAIASLPEDELKDYFDQYYQELAGQIPDEFIIDESLIPPEAMEQLILARQYIGYFQASYYYLIAFMVLLVLGIVLINRNVRDTTRALGIVLFIYGALELAAVYFAKNYAPTSLPLHDIPSSLQMWLVELSMDILVPLQMLSLGILIGGVILIVVSFVYKPREAED